MGYAICAHVVAACKAFDRGLLGKVSIRNYVYRSKRGPKPTANPRLQYMLENQPNEVIGGVQLPESSESSKRKTSDEDQMPAPKERRGRKPLNEEKGKTNEIPMTEQIPKKRGRPPLSEEEKAARRMNKGGRPKKAGKALSIDD